MHPPIIPPMRAIPPTPAHTAITIIIVDPDSPPEDPDEVEFDAAAAADAAAFGLLFKNY